MPQSVRREALRALELRKIGFVGATDTGWRRAHQLATRGLISVRDLRYVRNWFARHVHVSYPGFRQWQLAGSRRDGFWRRSRAVASWLAWGGTPGFRWVNSKPVADLLGAYFGTEYRRLSL